MNAWLGGMAGLATGILWAMSATAWGLAGRRIPSISVAAIRITLAAAILCVIHWIAFGEPWPTGVDLEPMALLAVSGIVGMAMGDMCFFRGVALIGPRLAMLILSLCPIVTTVMAWFTRNEHLSWRPIAGIALMVFGVAWVVSEPQGENGWHKGGRHLRLGVILMLISTVLTSAGYVVTAAGMAGGKRLFTQGPPLPPLNGFDGALHGTLIRVVAGMAATWAFLPMVGRFRPTLAAIRDRRAMAITSAGTVVGPVTGVLTSLVALHNAPGGIAAALIGTSPIFMIPLSSLAFKEKHTFRSLVGTLLAIGGAFLLLL